MNDFREARRAVESRIALDRQMYEWNEPVQQGHFGGQKRPGYIDYSAIAQLVFK